MCAGFSFRILLLQWYLILKGNTLGTQQKTGPSSWTQSESAQMKEHKSHLLLTMEYLESSGTFKENHILWSRLFCLPLSPPIFKPCALSPAHLNVSPFFLTPSIQSKPQSALAWIRELLGIPSVSILYVGLWECVKECTFVGCQGEWFVYAYRLLLSLFTSLLLFYKCTHIDLLFIVFIFSCVSLNVQL